MKRAKKGFAAFLKRRYGDRSTPKHYLSDLKQFIQQIGNKPPESVTIQDIDQFIDKQQQRGLQPSTINRRLASLYAFFEYIAEENLDQDLANPVRWSRHRIKEGKPLPRDASEEEVKVVFEHIKDTRDKAIFGLMVGAGLRVGEVVGLKCQNLEAADKVTGCARLRVCGKGKKERIVWVTPRWYVIVAQWLAERPESEIPYLFLNQHRRGLSVAGVQYRWRGYCQQAGVHLTCHQLRHTFARRLAEQQMPTESIAELMGHAQVTTTQRYTAGANPALRDAFLAAMTMVEEATEIENEVALLPRPPRQQRVADPIILEQSLAKLNDFPEWLAPTLQRYFRHRWQQWQPHTIARTAAAVLTRLLQFWQWLLAERQIADWCDLQRRDVTAWIAKRQAEDISPRTIRNELVLLKSCVRFAIDEGKTVSAHITRVKPPAQPQRLPRYLTAEQMQKLWPTVMEGTQDSPLDRAWFLTLAHTGIRCGELLDLRLRDLDLTGQRLFVATGKNGDERVVYLTPVLVTAFANSLPCRPASTSDAVWLNPDGRPLTYAQVNIRLGKWGQACGVPVTAHRLRHTFATQLINNGLPLQAVAKLLGHQSLNMTQHYARLYEQTVKTQFETAMAHIDGYLALDWPSLLTTPDDMIQKSANLADSV